MVNHLPGNVEVLIVGAGPTGLMMAGELARHGLPCRIIDKGHDPSIYSKALGVQARTLEVFKQIGIADEAVARGNKIYGGNVYSDGKRILHFSMDELDSPFPFILALPQSETEQLLIEHVEKHGINVERSVELVSLEQDETHVLATLQHADGHQEQVESSWLIGCDGAHSKVRHLLNVVFEGMQYDESFCLADCYAECSLPEDEAHLFMFEDGLLGLFSMGNQKWRVIIGSPRGAMTYPDPLTIDWFRELLELRGIKEMKILEPIWFTDFNVHQRKVKEYTYGRVFLAGDAAHIHSPVGGQGMNTGIQDAHNLAWKMALVANGHAHYDLLKSYQEERHEVARNLLLGTDLATKVVTMRNPIAQQVRNRLMTYLISQEVVQERLRRNVSEIVISYRNSSIVGEHHLKLASVQFLPNPANARPTLRQWFDFGTGPRPGDRAPDAKMIDYASQTPTSVFDELTTTKHTMFLVADTTNTLATLKGLFEIGRLVEREYGNLIRVVFVISGHAPPKELVWNQALLIDPELSFHHRYGAESECLYLIRPDGYVGYRSQPPDFSALQSYLRHIFIPDEQREDP